MLIKAREQSSLLQAASCFSEATCASSTLCITRPSLWNPGCSSFLQSDPPAEPARLPSPPAEAAAAFLRQQLRRGADSIRPSFRAATGERLLPLQPGHILRRLSPHLLHVLDSFASTFCSCGFQSKRSLLAFLTSECWSEPGSFSKTWRVFPKPPG